MFKKVEDNPLLHKSFDFSLQIIEIYRFLQEEKHEYVLSKQLLRSATSIGANLNEGVISQTRKDFIAKFSISLKEAYETRYWLSLLLYSKYLKDTEKELILLEEIIKMTVKSIKSAKEHMDNEEKRK